MAVLLTLEELKAHLNLTRAMNDAELRVHMDAAVALVDGYCGPTEARTVTAVVSGSPLVLSVRPVLALTSITPEGSNTAVDLTGVAVGGDGVVTGYAGGAGTRTTVVYSAGRAEAPAQLKMAAQLIAAHSWRTQRGPTGRAGMGQQEDTVVVGSGFTIPRQAWEYMQQFTVPAFA